MEKSRNGKAEMDLAFLIFNNCLSPTYYLLLLLGVVLFVLFIDERPDCSALITEEDM